MALQTNGRGAYAPPQAMINVLDRHRDRGLPSTVDPEAVVRAGITTESLAQRTVQSMKLLDWLDEDGQPTEEFNALRRVPTEQYKPRLADLLRTAYADVLEYTDPAVDSLERITDAFRAYSPDGMRDRMVTLFTHLMEYAGAVPEGRFTSAKRGSRSKTPGQSTRGRQSGRRPPGKETPQAPNPPSNAPGKANGHTSEVQLRSGGTVTVAVSINIFDLDEDDRTFVLGLVDAMRGYEREQD